MLPLLVRDKGCRATCVMSWQCRALIAIHVVVVFSARRPRRVVRGLGRAFLYLSIYVSIYLLYLFPQAPPPRHGAARGSSACFTADSATAFEEMGCGSSKAADVDERDNGADAASKELDRQMAEQQKEEAQVTKLLVLGTGESGKSTIFKQMKILYAVPDPPSKYIPVCRANLIGNAHMVHGAAACARGGPLVARPRPPSPKTDPSWRNAALRTRDSPPKEARI